MARNRDGETELSSMSSSPPESREDSRSSKYPAPGPEVEYQNPTFRRRNVFAFIFPTLFTFAWTIFFSVALIITVKVYDNKRILTKGQKDTFNTITTGMILFLGLSLHEAFKGLAKALRPHLENWFHPSPKHRSLVDGFDSLLTVGQYLFSNITLGFRILCVIWLFVSVGAQVFAAIISLTYSLDDGKDYNSIYLRQGEVQVSNLTCYMHNGGCPTPVTIDALAHAYGESTLGPDSTKNTDCSGYNDVQSVIYSRQDFRYYCRRNTTIQEFAYRFKEYNPNDIQQVYPQFTNRVITASSGKCKEYTQVGSVNKTVVGDANGLNFISAINYTYTDNITTGSILIPTSALGNDGTTYIYRGHETPSKETVYGNGPRGLRMWAYKNPGLNPDSRFYECPVTVDIVTNVKDPRHNISDALAREAVASIALQGQFKGSFPDRDFTQWQWYANGHPWEIHHHDNARVGANIAEHAIVSLAEMVLRNEPILIPGSVPNLGSKLSVKWKYFEALLAGILAVDAFMLGLTFWFARTGGAAYEQLG